MLRNSIPVALRALRRRLDYAALTLTGLAVGVATFLVIALYVWHETTYNHSHAPADRIAAIGPIFGIAVSLGVLIACNGRFGLAAFTVQQRTKEIGVRKALGATAAQIVGLLSKEFAVIVGVAFLVAAPAAYGGAQRWLQDVACHIELGPVIFALAGGLTLAIALATVSIQTLRAARIDPAQTLRSE